MVTARVDARDHFPEFTDAIERRIVAALNAGAGTAAQVAAQKANTPKPIARFTVLRARNIGDGYRSGVKAGPLVRIFDKGSLGKRSAALKRNSRKPAWEVKRGTNPYAAHRGDTGGEGIAPRGILNAGRKAGRETLLAKLHR